MGGGLLVKDASPVFIGCVFRDNNAQYGSGGGIEITGGAPVFLDCMITSNRADNIAGGLLIKDSDATFIRCGFVGNRPLRRRSVHLHDARPSFESCTFIDNAALLSGGGTSTECSSGPEPVQLAGNRSAIGSAICNLSEPSLINTCLDTDQQIKEAQPHPLHADEPPPWRRSAHSAPARPPGGICGILTGCGNTGPSSSVSRRPPSWAACSRAVRSEGQAPPEGIIRHPDRRRSDAERHAGDRGANPSCWDIGRSAPRGTSRSWSAATAWWST